MDSEDTRFFPDEVIVRILARLPVKSLITTKVVCKHFHRLASDTYFTRLYNELSVKNPMVLVEITQSIDSKPNFICVNHLKGVSKFSLDFLKHRVKVRASCNGLLCCSSIPEKGVYYVCNPLTRDFKLLPRNWERPTTRFHPDGEATLVGLACSLSANKFSVVLAGYHRFFSQRPDKLFLCFVFDGETEKWKKFESLQEDHFSHMNRNQSVYVNESLHWLTEGCSCVLALDIDHGMWRKMRVPNEVKQSSGNRAYLLESDGCLSIVQISDAWMSIWVLLDYMEEVWNMVDRVSLRCISGLVPGVFPVSQCGECVFLATHKHVLLYHRKGRIWKELYSAKDGSSLPLWFSSHAFRSTIFSCH